MITNVEGRKDGVTRATRETSRLCWGTKSNYSVDHHILHHHHHPHISPRGDEPVHIGGSTTPDELLVVDVDLRQASDERQQGSQREGHRKHGHVPELFELYREDRGRSYQGPPTQGVRTLNSVHGESTVSTDLHEDVARTRKFGQDLRKEIMRHIYPP